MSLKHNCACSRDELKVKVLKALSDIVSVPLAHICNLMMMTGKFANKMEEATVTALHKGGSVDG